MEWTEKKDELKTTKLHCFSQFLWKLKDVKKDIMNEKWLGNRIKENENRRPAK